MCSSFWVEQANIEDIFSIYLLVDSFVAKGYVKPLSLKTIRSCYKDFLVARRSCVSLEKKDEKAPLGTRRAYVPFEKKDEIVGCCALFFVSGILLELRSFVIDERYVGHGVAKMLMRRSIILAKKRKKSIFCFSQRSAFFEKFGFSMIPRNDLDVDPHLDSRYALDRREAGLGIYLYTP